MMIRQKSKMHSFFIEGKEKEQWWKKYDPYVITESKYDALARFPPGTLIEVSVKDKKSGYIHTHHGFVRNGDVYEERYEKTKAAIIEGMHYLLEANEKMGIMKMADVFLG